MVYHKLSSRCSSCKNAVNRKFIALLSGRTCATIEYLTLVLCWCWKVVKTKYCVLHHVDFALKMQSLCDTIETQAGWTFYANNGTSATRIAFFTQPNTKEKTWLKHLLFFYFHCFRVEQLLVFNLQSHLIVYGSRNFW